MPILQKKTMTYPGGKNGSGVYQKIISMMPPHQCFIEAFLGNGAILRNKKPAENNIGIEIDPRVIQEYWNEPLQENFTILKEDALQFLEKTAKHSWYNKNTLIYADPPYLKSVRRSQRDIYRYEMNTPQHVQLLINLKKVNCYVMISGYDSDVYNELLFDWRKETFTTSNRAGQQTTECVWLNFPEPLELHDYRFLGADYRKREDLKRKKLRWKKKLQNMPSQERFALMATIEELKVDPTTANLQLQPEELTNL